MEFTHNIAEWMGLTSPIVLPVLMIAAGCVALVLSGAAARTIEHVAEVATSRAVAGPAEPARRSEPSPAAVRPALASRVRGSVADPVRIAS